jgi:hypothetical protein
MILTTFKPAISLRRVLGRCALGIVEIGRTGNHRFFDGVAQVRFGVLLDLLQDKRGDLLRVYSLPKTLNLILLKNPRNAST